MAKLRTNILLLTIVQASNYLLPLLTLPYLGRVLSVNAFGRLALAQALTQYLVMLTEYGFNLTATRRISIARSDRQAVSRIFTDTLAAKTVLAAAGYAFVMALVSIVPKFEGMALLVSASYVGVIGSVLLPLWLFQGLEDMKLLVLASSTARILAVIAIFLTVHDDRDLVSAAVLQNAGTLFAGLIAVGLIRYHRTASLLRPSWQGTWAAMKDGWSMFLANIAISFYTTLNTVLLGLFGTSSDVAYFSAADKLRFAAQGVLQPIAQAIYPRVSLAFSEGRQDDARRLMKKGGALLVTLAIAAGTLFIFGSEPIASHYLGPDLQPAAFYLRLLAGLPLIIAIAITIGQWGLLGAGQSGKMSRIYLICGFCHLIYAIPLIFAWKGTGLIVSVYLTEFLATGAMVLIFCKCARPLQPGRTLIV
ncbi:oligosaccharide flippase family protein [Ralstonia mannitolilytica]|uniref:oligosaccharide flippase family protein n=1 Tax=Ralstonia mannitolilytica TaxID=105219 RepID=UPI000CEF2FDE|nr:oligosaccharide flippase family protein [Ralstonia mannitolilytica]MBU9578540.1 oligosaccharide flippase family protein [Ralstonia mannitolilytica]